ncbi:MAG: hypothetical protein JNK63_02915 [Chthonomonas sp.]|nr:hypothetical protein [Chthonomonas sp.]
MIRIVGIERNQDPNREFILLQNQGSLRQLLRGCAVIPDSRCDLPCASGSMHLFADETQVVPGAFIMLHTGVGEPKWTVTRDGSRVYHAYMNRSSCVWEEVHGPLHVLGIQHTYTERATQALTLR